MKRIFRKRILMASIGLLICGVGVGLFIAANMGADPATVFQMESPIRLTYLMELLQQS